ncbi:uncharacterized protein MONBRDRAFT_35550 [Monosiga brevicollis MX1]|uniref:Uncharacterized protein n=1 Tax=Monosiga brevicollis TaxID=81824 RepID=A9UPV4_MONBE|nr:uncharacterized protein MONBRDRAFT_35550 [Monosiga brevicollis MX1]EDQ92486.1 predicted protein [Monosiga brevicollis MX1]|eukprot:XP_001742248.1 hypothetical protein [Monosiga brevicollis MX1]
MAGSGEIDVSKFFKAVIAGDFGVVERGLSEGIKPDVTDRDGWTAAGRAVQKNRSGVLQLMLEHGLDANLSGSSGITLLHVAAAANKPLMCKMLLQAGADANVKNELGRTPLDVAQPDALELLTHALKGNVEPVVGDADYYVDGEQVYCQDKHGFWWPAVVTEVKPGNWYNAHFPGYGRREDVTVKAEGLMKINRATVTRFEEQREAHQIQTKPTLTSGAGATPTGPGSVKRRASTSSKPAASPTPKSTPNGNKAPAGKRKKLVPNASSSENVAPNPLVGNVTRVIELLRQHQEDLLHQADSMNGGSNEADRHASTTSQANSAQQATITRLEHELQSSQAETRQVRSLLDAERREVLARDETIRSLTSQLATIENDAKRDVRAAEARLSAAEKAAEEKAAAANALAASNDLREKNKQIGQLKSELAQVTAQINYYKRKYEEASTALQNTHATPEATASGSHDSHDSSPADSTTRPAQPSSLPTVPIPSIAPGAEASGAPKPSTTTPFRRAGPGKILGNRPESEDDDEDDDDDDDEDDDKEETTADVAQNKVHDEELAANKASEADVTPTNAMPAPKDEAA